MKLNKYLGFVLSLMGLIKTNYSPYAYHVHDYNKNSRKYNMANNDPYILRTLLTKKSFTLNGYSGHIYNSIDDFINYDYK